MNFDQIDKKFGRKIEPAEDKYCHECEDGGWTHTWGPEGRGPYFDQCRKCGNPHDYPRPF